MKINIAKDELLKVLTVVMKGTSSHSTLPILSGILVDASPEATTFQTTDLEISIRHMTQADVEEPGRTVLPGKLFSDIVKNLPDAAVSISSDDERTTISCLESTFTLSSLNPVDFPAFPNVATQREVSVPSEKLHAVVKKVGKAVSRDESRVVLTGILFSVAADGITFAATDSYRLAAADLPLGNPGVEPFDAIIPGKIFEDVARLAAGEEKVAIGFSENQIVFSFGQTVFVSRKIEGTYPNYRQLIPPSCNVSIRMDHDELVTAVKRVSLLAQSHTPVRFAFDAQEQSVVISAKTQDLGGAREVVAAKVDGEDIEIAFNHQYVLDGLSAIDGDVLIELQTSLKPGIFKNADDGSFLYLAMPVRLS